MNTQIRNLSSEKRSIRIRKREERRQLKEKENGFVLDCLNQAKSHANSYNSINDKFLRYCIIKVRASPTRPLRTAKTSCDDLERKNHLKFQEMIEQQKAKLMNSQSVSQIGGICTVYRSSGWWVS